MKMWTGFNLIRVGFSDRIPETWYWTSVFHKSRECIYQMTINFSNNSSHYGVSLFVSYLSDSVHKQLKWTSWTYTNNEHLLVTLCEFWRSHFQFDCAQYLKQRCWMVGEQIQTNSQEEVCFQKYYSLMVQELTVIHLFKNIPSL